MNTSSRRAAVFVLGVHRSGTSALTSVLAALGLDPGHVPVERNKENEDGFFEHPGFRQLNERILAAFGASWDNWALTADDIAAQKDALLDRFGAAARTVFDDFDPTLPLVLKDPRAVTLWPFWQEVALSAGLDPQVLIILRDPREVAQSQVNRAHEHPDFYAGLASQEPVFGLWAVAMHRLLAHLPDSGAILLRHRDLMSAPQLVAGPLAKLLDLPDITAEKLAAATSRIRPKLYRARQEDPEALPNAGWESLAMRLFHAMSAGESPRRITKAAATTMAADFPEMPFLMPYLAAVRESHASLRGQLRRAETAVKPLSEAITRLERSLHPVEDSKGIRRLLTELASQTPPDSPDVLFLRASYTTRIGDHAEAEALYRKLLTAAPDHLRGWIYFANLMDRLGRTVEAAELRKAAGERFPNVVALQRRT